jgi:hypothetical protein
MEDATCYRQPTAATGAARALDRGTRGLLDAQAAARFWDNVTIGEPDDCWPWVGRTGTREASGHVRIWHQGHKLYAHRLAYLLAGGEIGQGEVVRHAVCDVPACMNYLHMRVGSSAENTRDRDVRNRRTPFLPRGGAHWSAKLSDHDAERIRAGRALGLSAGELAALYQISRSSVYNIWSGLHYPASATSSVQEAA